MSQKLQELIKQSLKTLQATRPTVCATCPLNTYHELCRRLESEFCGNPLHILWKSVLSCHMLDVCLALDDTLINSAIRNKLESVVSGSETNSDFHDPLSNWARQSQSRRQSLTTENGALMSLLRQHFECLQQKHTHNSETPFKGGFFDNLSKAKKTVRGSIQEIKVSSIVLV